MTPGMLLVWGLAGAVEPSALPDPIADPAYAFCHEAGADADQVRAWCSLVPKLPPDACPGLRATCAAGEFEAMPTSCSGLTGTPDDLGGFAGHPNGEENEVWRAPPGCARAAEGCVPALGVGAGLSSFITWGAALVVALLVLLLVRLILRRLGVWTGRPAASALDPSRVELRGIEGDDDLPALPEDELLARAWALLEAGQLGDAVVMARGAALRRLARRGWLHLHRARTDREYLAALGDQPEERAHVAVTLAAVETHRFALRPLDVAEARAAVQAAARILAVLLIGLLLLPTPAWASRRYAPYGDAALYDLMEGLGWQVEATPGRLDAIHAGVDLVVLDLRAVNIDDPTWEALLGWVDAGGLLLVAGPLDDHFPEVGERGLYTGAEPELHVATWLADAGVPAPVLPNGPTYQWCDGEALLVAGLPKDAPRLSEESRPERARDCPEPQAVSALLRGDGVVIAIAEALLLRNGALMLEENRRFLVGVLTTPIEAVGAELPQRPVVWLATASSVAPPRNPFQVLAGARMLPLVVHLLVVWGVLVLARGWPLSPRRDPPEAGRRDFMEHVEALGARWREVGASRHAAASVASLVLGQLGARGLHDRTLRAGYDEAGAADLVRRAEAVAADPQGVNSPDDIQLVEDLCKVMRPT